MDQILKFCPDGTVNSLPEAVDSITSHSRWPLVECRLLEMHAAAMLQLMHSLSDLVGPDLEVGRPYGPSYWNPPAYVITANPRLPGFALMLVLSGGFVYSYLRCVAIGGDVLQQTLDHLSRLSYPKKLATFGHMVRYLIAQSVVEGYEEVAAPISTQRHPHMALNVVAFLVSLTKTSEISSVKDALLDATLLSISPFLSPSWDPLSVHGDIYRRAYFPRKRIRASYGGNTSNLLKEIRTSGLGTVVDEPSRTRTWVRFLQPLF
ncbi:hypothetical protein C8R46DRAFT_1135248, partial [Mycena filopes]